MARRRSAHLGALLCFTLVVIVCANGCGGRTETQTDVQASEILVGETPIHRSPKPQAESEPSPLRVTPPTAGGWIDVDVTQFTVRLMRGSDVLRTIGPVGVGRQIDTGIYESTQTGLFAVHVKSAGLTYDAPYNTYIKWWVGFDPDKANGFHTFLLDANGAVVDASTGRVSNGCIRSGEAQAIFEFAEIGMPVLVHS